MIVSATFGLSRAAGITKVAAEKLAVKAQSRWQENESGMIDDITVCMVRIVLGKGT